MGTCKDCLWRKPDERPEYINHGDCRRFPPMLVGLGTVSDTSLEQHWPWVEPEDWCGEWKPRAALQSKDPQHD